MNWGEHMSFVLETTDIDLGDTPIENIFINDFMPMANGTYVKVYLLGYKYAHDKDEDIEVDNKTIAKHLGIPLSDVICAWNFWEEKGIIKKVEKVDSRDEFDYGVEFLNLKQLYISNNYKPVGLNMNNVEPVEKEYSSSVRDILQANENPKINEMFNNIDYIVRRPLVPNEKKQVLEWIHVYNMNPDIIEKAFFYSVEKKGKRNVRYVGGIIKNWYDAGITNMDAYLEYLKLNNERQYNYNKIANSLGFIGRNLSEGERKLVDKWFDYYKFSLDIILAACSRTTGISNPNIKYVDKMLASWFEQGVDSLENIAKIEQEHRESKKPVANKAANNFIPYKKTRFHNFEQRTSDYTEDELEAIARRKREEYYKKLEES